MIHDVLRPLPLFHAPVSKFVVRNRYGQVMTESQHTVQPISRILLGHMLDLMHGVLPYILQFVGVFAATGSGWEETQALPEVTAENWGILKWNLLLLEAHTAIGR